MKKTELFRAIAKKIAVLFMYYLIINLSGTVQAQTKHGGDNKRRVLVLTDIENEPDDAESLVRFLLYSNQW